MIWFHSTTTCRSLFTGRGRGRRGEFHHPLLRADGLRGMSHPDGDAGDVLPGGPVSLQGSCQEAQTGHFWTPLLHDAGLSHQGLLPGRLPGRTEGKPKHPKRKEPGCGRRLGCCVHGSLVGGGASAPFLRTVQLVPESRTSLFFTFAPLKMSSGAVNKTGSFNVKTRCFRFITNSKALWDRLIREINTGNLCRQ